MSQPRSNQVHVDSILTNLSVAYLQRPENFVATRVFPIVPVEKQSDKYFVYTKADWFRDEARVRPPSTESVGSGYNVSPATYNCDVFALHKDVPYQVRDNSDLPLNPYRDAAEFVTSRLMLRLEKQWTTDYFTTGVWDNSVTPANLWSNYLTSDPIGDIETGKLTILQNTGFMPNKLVLGYKVFSKLKNHPDIIDRIKYTSSQTVTPDMLARMFEVDEVLVCKAVMNNAVEGATGSFDFVQGKHALLTYSAPAPSLLAPSAGYIFMWRGVSQGLGQNVGISREPVPLKKADRVEGEMAFDDKVVATDLGYFFNTVIA